MVEGVHIDYLTVAGSVVPIQILGSDSIASVKLRIQSYKGFFVKNQKLVFGGKELARNSSLVRDYGLTDGNILHLVLKLSDIKVITVRTVCGKELKFHVERKKSVGYVKQEIAKKGKGLLDIKNQELIFEGEELEDQRVIDDICKNDSAVIHLVIQNSANVRATPVERDLEVSVIANPIAMNSRIRNFILEPLIVNPKFKLPFVINKLISDTFDGLERGNQPIRSTEGSGGVYFMPHFLGDAYISVFKPIDEEPMAVNNPRGLPLSLDGEGLKKGTKVGEGALREVAAYLLDKGFAGVPPTTMVKCLHKGFNCPEGYDFSFEKIKIGSLQMFVENSGSCEDMGPNAFPVDEVHKISILDIRLANADRHAGNILFRSGGEDGRIVLIPIDHGYCIPENFEDCTFEWLYWPQARQPYSPDTIAYIKSLDPEQDIQLLRSHGWDLPLECARTLQISTMLLQKGAKRWLTPFAIGSIMCRETLKDESVIEKIVGEAQEGVLPGTSESGFMESLSEIMDRYLDNL